MLDSLVSPQWYSVHTVKACTLYRSGGVLCCPLWFNTLLSLPGQVWLLQVHRARLRPNGGRLYGFNASDQRLYIDQVPNERIHIQQVPWSPQSFNKLSLHPSFSVCSESLFFPSDQCWLWSMGMMSLCTVVNVSWRYIVENISENSFSSIIRSLTCYFFLLFYSHLFLLWGILLEVLSSSV